MTLETRLCQMARGTEERPQTFMRRLSEDSEGS